MSAPASFSLLYFGQPLLDISAKVSVKVLKQYGLNSNDMILADESHQPLYKEVQDHRNVTYLAGGSCQNSARGSQWLLPANSTCYVGCVGRDDAAKKLREAAHADGLRVEFVVDESLPTGKCAVLITGQDRSMAASKMSATTLESNEIWSLVENAQIFYTVGFLLKGSHDAIMKVAEYSSANNKVFAFNLSAPFLPEVFREELAQVIPHCDYLFANNLKTSSIRDIAMHLAKIPRANASSRPRTVIITQGPDPVIVATLHGVKSYIVPQVRFSDIVDTNGAGDGFCGGYLAALAVGKSTRLCVRSGLFVAGEILKQEGATYPKTAPHSKPWDEFSIEGCCSLQ
ncbi:adenosine kinase [Chytriomyces confervae]|uniref:Adenosine kinase n=1 Tax=Chytriomyces confervae TaxID=246404 RepID=A0A507FG82_9FUNG|nr:adenosine kinase [Chytriomyces confervae]